MNIKQLFTNLSLRNGGYLIMEHEVKHVLYTYFPKNLRVWGGEGVPCIWVIWYVAHMGYVRSA